MLSAFGKREGMELASLHFSNALLKPLCKVDKCYALFICRETNSLRNEASSLG